MLYIPGSASSAGRTWVDPTQGEGFAKRLDAILAAIVQVQDEWIQSPAIFVRQKGSLRKGTAGFATDFLAPREQLARRSALDDFPVLADRAIPDKSCVGGDRFKAERTDSGVGLLRRLGGDPRVEPFQKLEQLTWEVHSTAPLGRGCRGISVYRVNEKGGEVPSGAEKRTPERVEFTISVSALLGDNWSRIVCWTSGCGKKAAEAWNFVMQSPSNRLPEPLENVGIEWLRANSHASMTMLNSQSKRRRACACAAMSRIIRRLAKLADAQTAAQKAAAENLHASAPTAG
jgi:hypothetical protein